MTTNDKPSRRPRGLPASYVGMWLLLLSLSIAYLAGVAIKPELMAEILPPIHIGDPESNEGQRSAARSLAEADTMKLELERAKAELAELRAVAGARTSATDKQGEPISPGDAARPDAGAVAKPTAVPKASEKAADKARTAKQAPTPAAAHAEVKAASAQGAAAPAAQPPTRIINAAAADPTQITTGSILSATTAGAVAPGAFGPVTVKPARPEPKGPHALQLASGPSLDALRLSWVLLTERHGATLKGLEPRYVSGSDPAGPSYDLVAGPFANAEEATRACNALRAKKVACAVGAFAGNAL